MQTALSASPIQDRVSELSCFAVAHIYRDVAAGRPGPISKIGLGTFVDPREGGGKINGPHQADAVELLTLGER